MSIIAQEAEKIKCGIVCCLTTNCTNCPYIPEKVGSCMAALASDARKLLETIIKEEQKKETQSQPVKLKEKFITLTTLTNNTKIAMIVDDILWVNEVEDDSGGSRIRFKGLVMGQHIDVKESLEEILRIISEGGQE